MKRFFLFFALFISAMNSFGGIAEDSIALEKIKKNTRSKIISRQYDSAMVQCNRGLALSNIQKNDFIKAKFLSYKALIYRRLEMYDSALYFNLQCRNLRISINDEKGISATYLNLGTIYQEIGKYEEAKQYYQKALPLKVKFNETKQQIDIFNNFGIILRQEGKLDESNEYFEKAISKSKLLQDTFRIANSLLNLGINYSRIENFEASDYYYEEAFKLYKSKDYSEHAISCYINLARNLSLRNLNEEAFKKYKIALKMAESKGNIRQLAAIHTNMSNVLMKFENYQEALKYSLQGLKLNEKINRPSGITSSELNIARSYLNLGKYELAENFLNRALKRVLENNDRINERYVYEFLASLNYKLGRYKNAYDFREKYEALEDSVMNAQVAAEIEGFRVKYESKEKELQIEQLSKENEIRDLKIQQRTYLAIVLGFTSLMVFFTAFMLIRQNKLNAKKSESMLKQKLLRTQMNPHFIFNALGSIQNFIFSNKSLEAGKYLSKFSGLMRNILESSDNDLITLEQEIETIENYLLLQKLRKKESFDYEVSCEINDEINIPPMLAQPFIENSIKHAFPNQESGSFIRIKYSELDEYIKIEVQDNGIGIDHSSENSTKMHKSMAIKLTTERLRLISKKNKKPLLNITDLSKKGGSGTLVEISIPKDICLKY